MADAAPPRSTLRPLHDAALRRVCRRIAAGPAPWLHGEVARRMAERLPIIVQQPGHVIDWWPGGSGSADVLQAVYPRAERIGIEPDGQPAAPPRAGLLQRWRGAPAAPAAADMLWANMTLHWCSDPLAEMKRWLALTRDDGFLMFSTLGPGTLPELASLYAARGWPAAFAPFVDMHDLGDMLVEAGFADPVMDQEVLTLTWPDGAALLRELRTLGANVAPARHAGLRTPRWQQALVSALETELVQPGDGPAARLALRFEVVYGHAFRPRPRVPVAPRTTVGLEAMRSILRGPRGR